MKKTVQKLALGLLLATGLTTNSFAQWQNVGSPQFSAGGASFTSLKFHPTSGEPYVAYQDNYDKATVMKYNGTAWVNVGSAGFSAGQADYTSLAFSPSGVPYVVYKDGGNGQRATVMKYDGTNWVNVGSAGFSVGIAYHTSLAFKGDTAFVAFTDNANSNSVSVRKFDGTNWVNIGSLWTGSADFVSLAISPSGVPYVAFLDKSQAPSPQLDRVTVMKFVDGLWQSEGTPRFSAGEARFISLAFSTGGVAYVAFRDDANAQKATVMKFNGTDWVNIGTAGFSAGQAGYLSLALSPIGEPYVAYMDYGNSYKASVMKFDETNWVTVGTAGFSASGASAPYTSLAFSSTGEPYVAYQHSDDATNKATVMKYAEETTGINDIALSNFTAVYPNPANTVLNIEVKENTNIKIVNMLGAVVATKQLQAGNNSIDVSNLTKGVYFISNENGGAVKFIKE